MAFSWVWLSSTVKVFSVAFSAEIFLQDRDGNTDPKATGSTEGGEYPQKLQVVWGFFSFFHSIWNFWWQFPKCKWFFKWLKLVKCKKSEGILNNFTDCGLSEKYPWMFFLNLASFSRIQLKCPKLPFCCTPIFPAWRKGVGQTAGKGHEWKEKGKEDIFPKEHVKSLQVSSIRSGKDEVLNPWWCKPHWSQWRNTWGAEMMQNSDAELHATAHGLSCAQSGCKSSWGVNPHHLQD